MFRRYNPNPQRNNVGDCVIRSISKVLGYDWERTYTDVIFQVKYKNGKSRIKLGKCG